MDNTELSNGEIEFIKLALDQLIILIDKVSDDHEVTPIPGLIAITTKLSTMIAERSNDES